MDKTIEDIYHNVKKDDLDFHNKYEKIKDDVKICDYSDTSEIQDVIKILENLGLESKNNSKKIELE